jgi:hypothetical protein
MGQFHGSPYRARLLLTALKIHATAKDSTVIPANISIPTGHPQLKNA